MLKCANSNRYRRSSWFFLTLSFGARGQISWTNYTKLQCIKQWLTAIVLHMTSLKKTRRFRRYCAVTIHLRSCIFSCAQQRKELKT